MSLLTVFVQLLLWALAVYVLWQIGKDLFLSWRAYKRRQVLRPIHFSNAIHYSRRGER